MSVLSAPPIRPGADADDLAYEAQLLAAFHETRDPRLRDELIERHTAARTLALAGR